jgi:cytochrome c biogenesis protein CcdA
MAVEAYLPTLGVVIGTGAIDSINPCAIGVLILMISVMLGSGKSVKRMLALGSLYILAVFATYLVAGLGLIYFFSNIPLIVTEYLSIVVGTFIIFAGVLEVKDFFWYGRGLSLSIPPYFAKKLDKLASKTTIPGVILLGVFVSAVELPCTGAPYLAIITLLSQYFDFSAFMLLVLYNIIFVLPLLIILFMVAAGVELYKIKKWKQESRGFMRLAIGLTLFALGWLLILIANGIINFG